MKSLFSKGVFHYGKLNIFIRATSRPEGLQCHLQSALSIKEVEFLAHTYPIWRVKHKQGYTSEAFILKRSLYKLTDAARI